MDAQEAARIARENYLHDLQVNVADAYLLVRAVGENDIGSAVDWGRFEFDVIAFELVLKTMLADMAGPVEEDA